MLPCFFSSCVFVVSFPSSTQVAETPRLIDALPWNAPLKSHRERNMLKRPRAAKNETDVAKVLFGDDDGRHVSCQVQTPRPHYFIDEKEGEALLHVYYRALRVALSE